uniref:beta-1,3-glucosyltransferase-like n=1 Tax=Styela clava TaxID=7725 RepID=UPI00193A2F68|nr:beta-1,3-glucosyltransferase-like [Styela clava]
MYRYEAFLCCLVATFMVQHTTEAALPSLYIVIRSQPNSYHEMKSSVLLRDIEQQADEINADVSIVELHREWPDDYDKAWAILPIMPELVNSEAMKKDWVMFLEDSTVINIEKVLKVLSRFDYKKDLFLGRGLYDTDMVIIHHFSSRKAQGGGRFLFPDFDVGWVLSSILVRKVGDDWLKSPPGKDFLIDLKHEIAVHLSDKHNVELTNVEEFCGSGEETPNCATNVLKDIPICDDKITLDDILVSVKTTLMFHKDRVKVVMDTWGPKVKNIVFYSNYTDPSIPTIDCGVPNTIRGHCGKSDAILKDFLKRAEVNDYKWLVVADDDTIMSVARLVQFLNCYDHEEATFLGEKYGYGLNIKNGYAYITGGGGMVFSKPAVEVWVKECKCPSLDTPDDMYLGQCLFRKGVISTHSTLFHQARPPAYAKGFLANQTPISFHKHWMIDPIKVYSDWFKKADAGLPTYNHAVAHSTVSTTPQPIVAPTPLPPTPLENPLKDEL